MADLESLHSRLYATPEEAAEPACVCGHVFKNHHKPPFVSGHPCAGERALVEGYCFCSGYEPDTYDEADAAYDAAVARWERSEGR